MTFRPLFEKYKLDPAGHHSTTETKHVEEKRHEENGTGKALKEQTYTVVPSDEQNVQESTGDKDEAALAEDEETNENNEDGVERASTVLSELSKAESQKQDTVSVTPDVAETGGKNSVTPLPHEGSFMQGTQTGDD